jgi:hypothetical protein
MNKMNCDVIGGFPYADPNCNKCCQPLLLKNAWMTDGCPCNCELGENSMNETRWRLLMELQQQQARELEFLRRTSEGGQIVLSNEEITTDLTDEEIDELLERFDATVPGMQRKIVAQMVVNIATAQARIVELEEAGIFLLDGLDDYWATLPGNQDRLNKAHAALLNSGPAAEEERDGE